MISPIGERGPRSSRRSPPTHRRQAGRPRLASLISSSPGGPSRSAGSRQILNLRKGHALGGMVPGNRPFGARFSLVIGKPPPRPHLSAPVVLGLVNISALSGLSGWHGPRTGIPYTYIRSAKILLNPFLSAPPGDGDAYCRAWR